MKDINKLLDSTSNLLLIPLKAITEYHEKESIITEFVNIELLANTSVHEYWL